MIFFPEKNRQFVDKGKVKVYSNQFNYPASEYFITFDKKIILPHKSEIINDRRKNSLWIIIGLNGKMELQLNADNSIIIDSCAMSFYTAKGENKVFLNNISSAEADYLEIAIKSNETRLSQQSIDYLLKKNEAQLLVSPLGSGNSIIVGQSFWISKGFFEPNHPFIYKKSDIQSSLYIFLINGKVNINGWELNYNDAIQLMESDDLIVEITKPSELLIIEMSKP